MQLEYWTSQLLLGACQVVRCFNSLLIFKGDQKRMQFAIFLASIFVEFYLKPFRLHSKKCSSIYMKFVK